MEQELGSVEVLEAEDPGAQFRWSSRVRAALGVGRDQRISNRVVLAESEAGDGWDRDDWPILCSVVAECAVDRAGEIPRGIRWGGGGEEMDGTDP